MPGFVLYTFASIGLLSVVGFAVLLVLIAMDRARQSADARPAHKRLRSING